MRIQISRRERDMAFRAQKSTVLKRLAVVWKPKEVHVHRFASLTRVTHPKDVDLIGWVLFIFCTSQP
jgi:hypothetical protein